MQQLRAAVIGTGFIAAKKHLPAFRRLRSRAEVVAIVDVDNQAASAAATRFGIEHSYTSLATMIDEQAPDLIDICTPPRTHAGIALEALQSGAHVFVEKPMATTVDECDAMLSATREKGKKICVAHTDLFYPPFVKARRLVEDGAIGDFRGMRIFLSTPVDYMTSNEKHWANRLPGGVIGESGPHVVYMTLAFINPITRVEISGRKQLEYPWSPLEDYRIELSGERGTCSVACVYTTDEWSGQVDIWGSRGILKVDLELMSLVRAGRKSLGRASVARSGLKEAATMVLDTLRTGASVVSRRYRNTHEVLIGGFLDSIAQGTDPPVTGEDGCEAVRVMAELAKRLPGG